MERDAFERDPVILQGPSQKRLLLKQVLNLQDLLSFDRYVAPLFAGD
jgi:hypothetical protein